MSNQLATLTKQLASKLNIGDGEGLVDILKATAFKTKEPVSDAQMTALLIVANQYGLNPWTKELYAYPDKNNGIVPVVGIDGWNRIINTHPQYNGKVITISEKMIRLKGCKFDVPETITCAIYRKDRDYPEIYTERLEQVYREPFSRDGKSFDGPWQTHTQRMLIHKATIQCARGAFSFSGIYDEDEAKRMIDITDQSIVTTIPSTSVLPKGYAEKEAEYLDIMKAAAAFGKDSLVDARRSIPVEHLKHFWVAHGEELKQIAMQATGEIEE